MSVCIYFNWKQFQYQLALGSLKMDVEGSGNAWRNGKYKSGDGGQDLITIDGEKVTFNAFNEAKLKFGSFDEADPKVVEMTGEKNYNIERVRARHEGSQHAVDLMRVGLSLFLFMSLYYCDDLAFRLAAFGSIMNLK